MKLAVDAREAFSAQKAGKGQWTRGFIDELSTRDVDLTLLTDSEHSDTVCLPAGFLWHKKAATYVLDNAFDFYVSPTSFITPALLKDAISCIPVVHDLIAFQGEKHSLKARLLEKIFLPRALTYAAHICTVSNATKEDLVSFFPSVESSRISSIYAGPMQPNVPVSKPDGKTILCVGTLCPRKNQKKLITAYASLPESLRKTYRLVLVGARGWGDDCIVHHAQNTKGVEWLDYVSDERYAQLLSTATVFAYPSLYEGFGMQVLDAMQRGIPVLTSGRGSLAEVTGDAAFLVDPENDRSIADGLITLLEHEQLRTELSARGRARATQFSWKQTVDTFLEVCKKAL